MAGVEIPTGSGTLADAAGLARNSCVLSVELARIRFEYDRLPRSGSQGNIQQEFDGTQIRYGTVLTKLVHR